LGSISTQDTIPGTGEWSIGLNASRSKGLEDTIGRRKNDPAFAGGNCLFDS